MLIKAGLFTPPDSGGVIFYMRCDIARQSLMFGIASSYE